MSDPIDPFLRAYTKPAIRNPAFDGLRGVAILLVYLFHYGGGLTSANPAVRLFGYVTQAGWVGVDMFFALSGFLITRLFWDDREGPGCLRSFYARRALRILPLYFATLLLAAIVAVLNGAHLSALRPILLYAAFLQNVPPFLNAALQYPPPLPLYHLWSLAVEEQFYLIWPLLLLACHTRQGAFRLCLISFVLCCLFRNFVWRMTGPILNIPAPEWSVSLPGRTGALALGAALALSPSDWEAFIRRLAPPAIFLSLAGFIAVGFAEHSVLLNNPKTVILGLPCAELLSAGLVAFTAVPLAAPLAAPNAWRALFSTRPLRALGRISFGFYVFHILLEPCFDSIGAAATHTSRGVRFQVVRLLVAFPISLAAAWVSFHLYESPFLRLKRRSPMGDGLQGPTSPSLG